MYNTIVKIATIDLDKLLGIKSIKFKKVLIFEDTQMTNGKSILPVLKENAEIHTIIFKF